MHVTKNLCVNLLGFLGVYGKTKDTPEAWEDLQRLHEKYGMCRGFVTADVLEKGLSRGAIATG